MTPAAKLTDATLGDKEEEMTEKERIREAWCTLFSDDFARSVTIRYTDKTKKYFAVGKEYAPDIDFEDLPEIPITMTDFFYEADEEARKWIEDGPTSPLGDEAIEKEKIREEYCHIFPKDFERYVIIKYSSAAKKYFVTGAEYNPDLDRHEEEIPITMTDFFHEAEKEAWKWIEAGPTFR